MEFLETMSRWLLFRELTTTTITCRSVFIVLASSLLVFRIISMTTDGDAPTDLSRP